MTAFLLGATAMVALALAFALAPLLRRDSAGAAASGAQRARDWAAIGVGLALPVAAALLYACLGTPQALLAPRARTGDAAIGPAQVEAMVNRLAERLKTEPEDVDGWRMLAHSYETLHRFDAALDAYRHLLALAPDNPDVLTDCAVALGMSLNQDLSGEPERLIDRALAINPDHVQALALKGSAAYERGDYAQAIPPWKRILAMVPQDSDMARSIAASVAKAESFAARQHANGNGAGP